MLPLDNLSGDPQQEYLADGMTEALIADLGQIAALRVISRTSVMRYKGTKRSLPEIADELNVDAVAEGSVIREGNRVRITAQLIEAKTDRHLWAHSYERDLKSVLALQGPAALNCLLSGCSRTGDRGRTTRAPSSVLLGRGPWKVDAVNIHPRKLAGADDAASFVISGEAGRSLSSTAKAAICGYRPEGTAHC